MCENINLFFLKEFLNRVHVALWPWKTIVTFASDNFFSQNPEKPSSRFLSHQYNSSLFHVQRFLLPPPPVLLLSLRILPTLPDSRRLMNPLHEYLHMIYKATT